MTYEQIQQRETGKREFFPDYVSLDLLLQLKTSQEDEMQR